MSEQQPDRGGDAEPNAPPPIASKNQSELLSPNS